VGMLIQKQAARYKRLLEAQPYGIIAYVDAASTRATPPRRRQLRSPIAIFDAPAACGVECPVHSRFAQPVTAVQPVTCVGGTAE